MKETLKLPAAHAGAAWLMRFRRHSPPRHLHHHTELELNLVISGEGTYLLENRKYALRRCTLFWLFPDQDHLLLEASENFEMWILVFRPELVDRSCATPATAILRESNPPGEFSKVLAEAQVRRLAQLFAEIHDAATAPDRLNAGLAYALLAAWAAHQSAARMPDRTAIHPAIERAVNLMRFETTPMNLDALARHVGLSPSRLSRVFHDQMGMSLTDFRNHQRLERFLSLAARPGRRKLLTNALDAGFGSYPQFHRVFKRHMGCTPRAYHKRESGMPASTPHARTSP
ncbi:MAG: AraC family transcriptional regulator [Lentisphaerae bacterium]|nr:AraC family transcriptional regulator [Lentisphaerota bacterium]